MQIHRKRRRGPDRRVLLRSDLQDGRTKNRKGALVFGFLKRCRALLGPACIAVAHYDVSYHARDVPICSQVASDSLASLTRLSILG